MRLISSSMTRRVSPEIAIWWGPEEVMIWPTRRREAELLDGVARHLVDLLQVVGGARGDLAEADLLGGAAGHRHDHPLVQVLLGGEGAVLAAVEGEAAGVAAGEDRDPLRLLVGGAELGGQAVAGLVPGDDLELALGDAPVGLLGAGDGAQQALVEVGAVGSPRGRRGRP